MKKTIIAAILGTTVALASASAMADDNIYSYSVTNSDGGIVNFGAAANVLVESDGDGSTATVSSKSKDSVKLDFLDQNKNIAFTMQYSKAHNYVRYLIPNNETEVTCSKEGGTPLKDGDSIEAIGKTINCTLGK